MGLSKYKLAKLLFLAEIKNESLQFGVNDVRGISIKKMFIETKADMEGVFLRPYLIIKPTYFCYVTVTSRNGGKISLAYNDTNDTYIASSSYVAFYVNRLDLLNPKYLFIYFNRPEFDRFSRFNSWGSARETFSWEDLCDITIELPDIDIQNKVVAVYEAMVENQKAYETGLDDLKLTCDAYIEKLRRDIPCEKIGKYIEEKSNRNYDKAIRLVQGVNATSQFGETKAKMDGIDISNYKVVVRNDIAYNPSRINIGSIAIRQNEKCIVSPMYVVFGVKDECTLLAKYLMLWLTRNEFLRSTLFYAIGSVRDIFDFSLMEEVKIPIPNIKTQQDIVDIYNAYNERKAINEQLKAQLKNMCPILIKGSIEC